MKEGTERGGATEESQKANSKKEASGDASKRSMKPAKSECIHVRARRGQATDSHSLAERVSWPPNFWFAFPPTLSVSLSLSLFLNRLVCGVGEEGKD